MASSSRSRPVDATPFIGREAELASLAAALAPDTGTRLITLTGIGGIGKTRLATQVARRVEADGSEAVFVAELAPVSNSQLVLPTVAAAVGLAGHAATLENVIGRLRDIRALLVLDNCEHVVVEVAALCGALLGECPAVRILATSRIVLGLQEETIIPVPPLSLVAAGADGGPSEAERLFLDRAARVHGGGAADAAPGEIARIVEDLDGIPLAIELAAARTRVLSTREIADGLVDHLTLLGGAPRHAPARHRTMRASLDLSAGLLEPDERALFAELSVFVDSFTLQAAEAVCGRAVLDGLTALVDHSLLTAMVQPRGTRYRFPEFVRQYASELLGRDALAAVRQRHRAFFLRLAERCEAEHWAFAEETRLRLIPDMPNVLAALEHAADAGHTDALELVAALGCFWSQSGRFAEAAVAARRALDATPETPSPARAITLERLSMGSMPRGEFAAGRAAAVAAVEVAEATGDARALAVTITREASQRCLTDPSGVLAPLNRAIRLAREAGDLVCLSDALLHVCMSAHLRTDLAALDAALPEALRVTEALNHTYNLRWILYTAGLSALWAGRLDDARAYAARGLGVDGGEDQYSRTGVQAMQAIIDARTGRSAEALERASGHLAVVLREQLAIAAGGMLAALTIASLASGDADAAERYLRHLDAALPTLALRYERHHNFIAIGVTRGDADFVEEHARSLAEAAAAAPSARHAGLAAIGFAEAALLRGNADAAERRAKEALGTLVDAGWWLACLDALDVLAAVAVEQDDPERAARYLAAVSAAREQHGVPRVPPAADRWSALAERARAQAGAGAFDAAWAAGRGLSARDAAAYALRSRGSRRRPPTGWESLTPIERQVAKLAADGLTNPEIAERVFLARSTVKMHLSSVYAKLDVKGRVALVAIAAGQE